MATGYLPVSPTRDEIDHLPGLVLVEFGAASCGICRSLQPVIARALSEYPGIQHLKVADGSGEPLGRSFGVKLWPTLIALRDGREVGRLVRPTSHGAIASMLASMDGSS